MSNTQNTPQYQYSAGPGGMTSGGTQWNVELGIAVIPAADFTDEIAGTLHAALVAAFVAAGFSVAARDISIQKLNVSQTNYATDYDASPVTFS